MYIIVQNEKYIYPDVIGMDTMDTTEETRTEGQEQSELKIRMEKLDPLDTILLTPGQVSKCRCRLSHAVRDFCDEPIRVFDWAILETPLYNERYLILAFNAPERKGERHGRAYVAYMAYDEETRRLLESLTEKFREGYGALLTPCRQTVFEEGHGALFELRERIILESES